jgi:PPOX class probable F420-dependent enzyme
MYRLATCVIDLEARTISARGKDSRMNHSEAMEYIAKNTRGVPATIKRDGRPQLSNISYTLDDDGLIKISVTEDRAKTKNARRDPRVSMTVIGDNWYQYIVVEGTAGFIDDNPLPALRHVYERVAGKPHPDWDEFDQAMINDRRVVMTISVDRLYPLPDE